MDFPKSVSPLIIVLTHGLSHGSLTGATASWKLKVVMGYGLRSGRSYKLRPRTGKRPNYGARSGTKRKAASGSVTKRARSRTMTKTKKKKEQTVKAPSFGGISHSYASLYQKRRYRAAIKDLSSPYTHTETTNGEVTTGDTLGYQAVNYAVQNMQGGLNPAHIIDLMNQAQRYIVDAAGTAGVGQPGVANGIGQQLGYKAIIDSCITKCMMGNMTATGCIVDIYDVVAKRDIMEVGADNGPVSCWRRGLMEQQALAPVPSDLTTADNQVVQHGAVPTTSQPFNYNWRIVKRTRVELGPGQTHEHVFVHKPNRLIDTQNLYIEIPPSIPEAGPVSSQFYAIKGLSHRVMVVARGLVVETNDNSGQFSSAVVKLGLITSRVTRIRRLIQRPRMSSFAEGLPNIPATTQRYYNPGSGEIDTGVLDT